MRKFEHLTDTVEIDSLRISSVIYADNIFLQDFSKDDEFQRDKIEINKESQSTPICEPL